LYIALSRAAPVAPSGFPIPFDADADADTDDIVQRGQKERKFVRLHRLAMQICGGEKDMQAQSFRNARTTRLTVVYMHPMDQYRSSNRNPIEETWIDDLNPPSRQRSHAHALAHAQALKSISENAVKMFGNKRCAVKMLVETIQNTLPHHHMTPSNWTL
jgi:hypothetical protein